MLKRWLTVGIVLTAFRVGPALAMWQNYDQSNGLPSTIVMALAEDKDENIWIGTLSGLARYDGITWTVYRGGDGPPSGSITSLFCDRAGGVWVGTNAGLALWSGTGWITFTTSDGLPTNGISCITQDDQGRIWAGTHDDFQGTGLGGIARYDGSTWHSFTTADGLPSNIVIDAEPGPDGALWIATQGGVARYDGTAWTSRPEVGANLLFRDSRGGLWFAAGYQPLKRFDGTTWQVVPSPVSAWITAIGEDHEGSLWLGFELERRVARLDGSVWTIVPGSTDEPLLDGYSCILGDRTGNIWFGSSYGLSRHDRSRWLRMTAPTNDIHCALADSSGGVWIGTEGAGAGRFEGDSYTELTGLPGTTVSDIAQRPGGELWFAVWGAGVVRLDGATRTTFTTSDGLPSNYIRALHVNRDGTLWCGGPSGVARFDGASWIPYTTTGTIPISGVLAIGEDAAGNVWVGTADYGALRFDGTTWHQYTTADGLGTNEVTSFCLDRDGALWIGTDSGGVSRIDGAGWTHYGTKDGLASLDDINAILQDRDGILWFVANGGASRFDGERWQGFSRAVGLLNESDMTDVVEDRSGNLWFTSRSEGIMQYEPDRVGSQTVLVSRPPSLSSARQHTGAALAAFGEALGVEYSYRVDQGTWSPWSVSGLWSASALSDGAHAVEVRSRDHLDNVDPTPAIARFAVDATAPAPTITGLPAVVRGSVAIQGTTWDARFAGATITFRGPAGESTRVLDGPVVQGDLTTWDTTSYPDGAYTVVLSVQDSLGLTGTSSRETIVDNNSPAVEVTSPARVSSTQGGEVFTNGGEWRLYFPPGAFVDDAVVTLVPFATDSLDTLATGARPLGPGYEVTWTGGSLAKPARLDVLGGVQTGAGTPVLYRSPDGVTWTRVGGTLGTGSPELSAFIQEPGRYALYSEPAAPVGGTTVSDLHMAPRVFSPTGTYADRELAIGFDLGRSGPVTVRVYNRAGRLVREVTSGTEMSPGANVVRWDGRDRGGVYVADGIYLVTVEALGFTRRGTLAVVR